MDDKILLGIVAAAVVALVGKIVWDWLRGNRTINGRGSVTCHKMMKKAIETIESDVDRIKDDTGWTKDMHDQTDESGRPKWFFPVHLSKKIDDIDDNAKNILIVIKQLLEENKATNAAIIDALRSR